MSLDAQPVQNSPDAGAIWCFVGDALGGTAA